MIGGAWCSELYKLVTGSTMLHRYIKTLCNHKSRTPKGANVVQNRTAQLGHQNYKRQKWLICTLKECSHVLEFKKIHSTPHQITLLLRTYLEKRLNCHACSLVN